MLATDLACDFRAAQTPVRYQVERETCAVFAATAAHEWMAGDAPDLSEEDALCSAKEIDATPGDATWVDQALTGIDRNGQAHTSDWPYGHPHHTAGRPATATDADRRRRCGPVSRSTVDRIEGLAGILAATRAVIVTVAFVPATWKAATVDGWIDDPDPPIAGGHAVLAIGCLTAASGRPDALIFKNSWSPAWGDRGYGFFTDRYLAAHHQYTDVLEASHA